MIPLNIALGPKAVCYILDKYENRMKMEQHCLIYTDKMIERYIEIDADAAESLIGYIDAHEGEYGFSNRLEDVSFGREPIEQMLARICPKENRFFPSGIVILYEDENGREVHALGKKRSNILTTKEIKDSRKNAFYMLSPDTGSIDVDVGEDCMFWAEYFSRIIEGEKTVLFMNRYALDQEAIRSFKEYYVPYLSKSTRVIIYGSDTYVHLSREEAIKCITDDKDLNKLNIELYLLAAPHECHERWIQTENYYIYQGKGTGMLNANKARKTSATSTVFVEKRRRALPSAERVI